MATQGDAPSARTDRALITYIQQELSAPAQAIAGYAEMLLDEAEKGGRDDFREDLERIQSASRALNGLIALLVDPMRSGREPDGDGEDYRRRLRHDLRTPINAIKGYGEMLREDAADFDDAGALVEDLDQLLAEASRLLIRIDSLVDFSLPESEAAATGAGGGGGGGGAAPPPGWFF
jgi:adenylate cyclase